MNRQRCWCCMPPVELHRSIPPPPSPTPSPASQLQPPLQQPHPGGTSWHPGCQPPTSGPSSEAAAGPTYMTNRVGEPKPLGMGASGEMFPFGPQRRVPQVPPEGSSSRTLAPSVPEANLTMLASICTLLPWPQGLDPKQTASPSIVSERDCWVGPKLRQMLQETSLCSDEPVGAVWKASGESAGVTPGPTTSYLVAAGGGDLRWEPQQSVFPQRCSWRVSLPLWARFHRPGGGGREERLEASGC